MFLFRGGDTHVHNAKDSKEVKEYIQSWTSWQQGLGLKGILAGGDPLQTIGKQVNGKNKVVTDGPFTDGPFTDGPFTDGPFTDGPFTDGPFTDGPFTDGPFVEAKEMVGGYLIVNAKDIDEAVEIAKGCPIFKEDGKVEVRPIQKQN